MSTTASPLQIKAFLATIKEGFLNVVDENINKELLATLHDINKIKTLVTTGYSSLLKLELVQRGVVVIVNNDDGLGLLQHVQSTAGKVALNVSGYPLPLLAGCAIMASKVAEAISKLLIIIQKQQSLDQTGATTNSSDCILGKYDPLVLQTALKRCKDVHDDRLRLLLLLYKDAIENNINLHGLSMRLLLIAESYAYTGTTFQPEAPPLWKRVWDIVVESQQALLLTSNNNGSFTPWQAATALENLRRIAKLKNNTKRTTELNLKLAECYLLSINDHVLTVSSAHDEYVQVFIAPFRPTKPPKFQVIKQEISEALHNIKENLSDLSSSVDDTSIPPLLTYHLLLATYYYRQDETDYEAFKQQELTRQNNRIKEGSSPLKKDLGSTENERNNTQLYQKYLTRTMADDLHQAVGKLIDVFSTSNDDDDNGLNSINNDSNLYVQEIYKILHWYLARQIDQGKAKLIMQQKANQNTERIKQHWRSIANLVKTLIAKVQSRINVHTDSSSTTTEMTLRNKVESWIQQTFAEKQLQNYHDFIESLFLSVPHIDWIYLGLERSDSLFSLDELRLTEMILQAMLRRAQGTRAKDTKAITSKIDSLERFILRLNYAHASIVSRLVLLQPPDIVSYKVLLTVTNTVLQLGDAFDVSCEMGSFYFGFLVAWSGLSRSPWSACTLSEARDIVKKAETELENANRLIGRPVAIRETLFLGLAKAHMEGTVFRGGLVEDAKAIASNITAKCHELLDTCADNTLIVKVVNAHCRLTNAKILLDGSDKVGFSKVFSMAEDNVGDLSNYFNHQQSFDVWQSLNSSALFVQFAVSVSRQFAAKSLSKLGRYLEAERFLEEAVHEAPNDAGAAFMLGAYRLQRLFSSNEKSANDLKSTQVQLLKAAKLDSSKAEPFALLGYWYEYANDVKRATGCYSKALLLDPSNPIAGRGLSRLISPNDMLKPIDNAINSNSDQSGWAWKYMGLYKAQTTGEDELAVIALLKALRCVDIDRPETHPLAFFYCGPNDAGVKEENERLIASYELANCYRRLGRYTASLKTYHSAIEAAKGEPPSSLLCACASIELELGLVEEAVEKYEQVLDKSSSTTTLFVAALGVGQSFLSLAQRDMQDGKAGGALSKLKRAINDIDAIENKNFSLLKTLGDLYSSGADLPPDVFTDDDGNESSVDVRSSFVAKGEYCYRKAESLINSQPEENESIRASIISDIASNVLLQAQLQSLQDGRGVHNMYGKDCQLLFEKAENEYRRALQINPLEASAWCGLGCSVLHNDALLAQHAFSRSIQLEPLTSYPHASLCLLYTAKNAVYASTSVAQVLTQVADTPLMWINQAYLLERQISQTASSTVTNQLLQQVSDAYRSALQITKISAALYGLGLTCRLATTRDSQTLRIESAADILEYESLTGTSNDVTPHLWNGLAHIEAGIENQSTDLIQQGKTQLQDGIKMLEVVKQSDTKENKSTPDLSLFQKVVADASTFVRSFSTSDPMNIERENKTIKSIHRQIFYDPERADLWLLLAKRLASNIQQQQHNKSKDHVDCVVADALMATKRASHMFQTQLMISNTTRTVLSKKTTVHAADLADAMSLQYYLENLCDQAKTNTVLPDSTNEMPRSFRDLQCALLLDPDNCFARQILQAQLSVSS